MIPYARGSLISFIGKSSYRKAVDQGTSTYSTVPYTSRKRCFSEGQPYDHFLRKPLVSIKNMNEVKLDADSDAFRKDLKQTKLILVDGLISAGKTKNIPP